MTSSVTVIIPTHNRPRELAVALRSVLGQRNVELDVVVVDDGSADPDVVLDVAHRAGDRRVSVHRHDSSLGVSAARNAGIALAGGRWLAFLDDDDLWAPDKLCTQLSAVGRNGRRWAYVGHVLVDGSLHIVGGTPPPSPESLMDRLRRANIVPAGSSNVVVDRELIARTGPFDPGLLSGADWDLWIRLADDGPPAVVPAPFLAYRVHSGSMTRDRARMLRDAAVIASRYGLAIDWPAHHRWAAWDSLIEGKRYEAMTHYARAVRAGDLRSVPRAILGLLLPGVGGSRWYRRRVADEDAAAWAREADSWLASYRT